MNNNGEFYFNRLRFVLIPPFINMISFVGLIAVYLTLRAAWFSLYPRQFF